MRIDCGMRRAGMAVLTVALLGSLLATPAAAQRRGMSSAQMKQIQQQQQQMQQNQYGMQLVLQKRQKDMLAKFDLDGDGKLNSKEKPAADKYWREVKQGKQPNPLDPSTITQQDIDAALKSATPANPAAAAANKPPVKKPNTN